MGAEHAVFYSFVLYVIAVLLPIVPAVVLFKLFPDTRVGLRGPWQNLTLNATGAFAGYVVVLAGSVFLIQNVIRQIEQAASSAWTLEVPVVLVDANNKPIEQGATVEFVDLNPRIYRPAGKRVYVTIPHQEGEDWPTIYIGVAGFKNGELDVQQIMAQRDPKIADVQRDDRRIVVKKPVELSQLGASFTSTEYESLPPLEPLKVTSVPK